MLDFSLSEEQKALANTVRQFTADRITPVAAECDREGRFPHDVYRAAWELGPVAPVIPEEYGGAGLPEIDHTIIVEEMGYGCTGIQTSVTATTLAATPLIVAGTDEQKKEYLGRVARDGVYASYAITEPAAGSDAAGIQCKAVKHGNDWALTGQKLFITNASYANWLVVFATVDPSQ